VVSIRGVGSWGDGGSVGKNEKEIGRGGRWATLLSTKKEEKDVGQK